MSKPSDPRAPRRAARRLAACGALCALIVAPVIAAAGVSTLDPAPAPAARPAPQSSTPVQIRCWQDGRLLFEENGVRLPEGTHYGTVVSGSDRQGRALYVAETRNATCLIRQATPERGAWPR